jgi:hypothetical protein
MLERQASKHFSLDKLRTIDGGKLWIVYKSLGDERRPKVVERVNKERSKEILSSQITKSRQI